jgi:hypothetical protein
MNELMRHGIFSVDDDNGFAMLDGYTIGFHKVNGKWNWELEQWNTPPGDDAGNFTVIQSEDGFAGLDMAILSANATYKGWSKRKQTPSSIEHGDGVLS